MPGAPWYDRDYYADSPADDPLGPEAGLCRVRRGGCWYFTAGICGSSFRGEYAQTDRAFNLGFRVAADPSGE